MIREKHYSDAHAELSLYPDSHPGFDRLAAALGVKLNSPEETQRRNIRTGVWHRHHNAGKRGVRLSLEGLAGECLQDAIDGRNTGIAEYEAKYGSSDPAEHSTDA